MEQKTDVVAPIDFVQMMADAAAKAMSGEKPDNKFISFKSGMLALNGNAAPGNKLDVVILNSCLENQLYTRPFDPDKASSPDCWALGHSEEEMAPSNDVENPASPDCANCPNNEWGSDPKGGKGKACKNTRRLALIQANQLNDLTNADVYYARLPVTSVANWAKYVMQIGNVVKRPPFGVITEISVSPDLKTQFKVNFQFRGLVEDSVLEALFSLHEGQNEGILFGYPKNSPEPEPKTVIKPKAK